MGVVQMFDKRAMLFFRKVGSKVKDVRTFDTQTYYLTTDGDLYVCGTADPLYRGEYATVDVYPSNEFIKISTNISQVDYACSQVFFLTKTGDLCEYNHGTITTKASNVRSIECFDCFEYSCFYITKDGDLYEYRNPGGTETTTKLGSDVVQLAVRAYDTSLWYITRNGDLYDASNETIYASNVSKVACTREDVWYITNNGILYKASSETPTQYASNVATVSCSHDTTWYITRDGDLYGLGDNKYGQQGDGTTNEVSTFTKRASNVEKVDFGYITPSLYEDEGYFYDIMSAITWYIDKNGDLFGCGWNNFYQLGTDNYRNVLTFEKRASNAKKVKCNGQYTVYLSNDNSLYVCGDCMDINTYTSFTKIADNVKDFDSSFENIVYLDFNGNVYGMGYIPYFGRLDFFEQIDGDVIDIKILEYRIETDMRRGSALLFKKSDGWIVSEMYNGDIAPSNFVDVAFTYTGCYWLLEDGTVTMHNMFNDGTVAENVKEIALLDHDFLLYLTNDDELYMKGAIFYQEEDPILCATDVEKLYNNYCTTTDYGLYKTTDGNIHLFNSYSEVILDPTTIGCEDITYHNFGYCSFIDENKDLYAFSCNRWGELGIGKIGNGFDCYNEPKITKIASGVVQNSCGCDYLPDNDTYNSVDYYTNWYITSNGDLYSCGYNTSYNQAIPSNYEKIEPFFDKRNNVTG